MTKARNRIARVEAKRPREIPGIAFAASGTDKSDAVVAWFLRLLDKRTPPAQG